MPGLAGGRLVIANADREVAERRNRERQGIGYVLGARGNGYVGMTCKRERPVRCGVELGRPWRDRPRNVNGRQMQGRGPERVRQVNPNPIAAHRQMYDLPQRGIAKRIRGQRVLWFRGLLCRGPRSYPDRLRMQEETKERGDEERSHRSIITVPWGGARTADSARGGHPCCSGPEAPGDVHRRAGPPEHDGSTRYPRAPPRPERRRKGPQSCQLR